MASRSRSRVSRNLSSESVTPAGSKRLSVRASVAAIKDDDRPTLAYKVLSPSKTKKLMDADDVSELEHLVIETLEIKDPQLDLKAAAVLDFYVGALWWCKQQSFNADQTSAFFTVVHTIIKNIEEREMNLADNVLYLKKVLTGIGFNESYDGDTNEPGGLQTLFDVSQAKNIITYIDSCVFQHYKLYELLFRSHQSDHVIGECLNVETIPNADLPWPPPLCEAMTLPVYQEHCLPQEPTQCEVEGSDQQIIAGDETVDVNEQGVETSHESAQQEADMLAKLTPEQIQQVIEEVCNEMLGNLETEVATKLRKKENDYVTKINQLNIVVRR